MSVCRQIEVLASTWLMYSHVCVSTDRGVSLHMADVVMSACQQIEVLASTWLMYSHVCVSADRNVSFHMADV